MCIYFIIVSINGMFPTFYNPVSIYTLRKFIYITLICNVRNLIDRRLKWVKLSEDVVSNPKYFYIQCFLSVHYTGCPVSIWHNFASV